MFIDEYVFQMDLEQLTQTGHNYNFRCPVCGDSLKNIRKKRGWFIYSKNQQYYFRCYNCNVYAPFLVFMRDHYPSLYNDYKKNIFNTRSRIKRLQQPAKIKKEQCIKNDTTIKCINDKFEHFINREFKINKTENVLVRMSDINKTDTSFQYLQNRKIPTVFFKDLYYTRSFMHLINCIKPDSFSVSPRFDERIIIPFRDNKGNLIGMQGRSLDKDTNIRYLTFMFDKEHPKVFGLNHVNVKNDIYVLEGPFDSMFINNSIAMAGASVDVDFLLNYADKSKYVFLFDLEPRNNELLKQIEKIIYKGFKVCLLPDLLKKYGKDINDFILNGLPQKELLEIIKNHTYSGFIAKTRFGLWKKIYLTKK